MDLIGFLTHLTYIAAVFAMGVITGYAFKEGITVVVYKLLRRN